MPPIAPPNSATQTTLRPIHIHIVDEFNLDTSLEVASTMLASPNLASCQQIRISTSGLHPSLSAHPKLTSSSSSSSSSFSYGKTSLVQLQNVLGLSNEKLERYQLVTSTPRNFLTLERKCTRSSTTSPTPFDVVICCSQEVYHGVCQYYSTSSFQMKNKDSSNVIASQTLMSPHSVFVVFVDSKYYSNTTNNQTNNSNNKPTQGLLLTSLLVELLDLVHLKRKSSTKKDENDDDSGVKKEEESEINEEDDDNVIPQSVMNGSGEKWKEDFAKTVKQFEKLRRVEVMFRPFVV